MAEPGSGPEPRRDRPPVDRRRPVADAAAVAPTPEAMAAARGGAVEGLAWLGRTPESKASWSVSVLRLVARS